MHDHHLNQKKVLSAFLWTRGMDVGRTESRPSVLEKIRGKRPAIDEPAQKKRRTGATAPRKLGGISLGDDQTTQT